MYDWKWLACGKHPLTSDFVQIGQETFLGLSFCRWIQSGYEKTLAQQEKRVDFHSWRFWARGNGQNELILGLVRDRSDSRGRRFPLLVLGIGNLKGWANFWRHLPLTCESVWQAMEQLTVVRLSMVRELEQQLMTIQPPKEFDLASILQSEDERIVQTMHHADSGIERISLYQEADPDSMVAFRIDTLRDEGNLLLPISYVHHQLQADLKRIVPQIVFIGGTPMTMFVLSFFRSLTVSDFVWMWTINRHKIN